MSSPFVVPKEELKSPSQRTPGALLKFVQFYYCCSSILRGIVLFILWLLSFVFFAAPISPEKQAQLRSVFQKRRSTPVRRSTFGESVSGYL